VAPPAVELVPAPPLLPVALDPEPEPEPMLALVRIHWPELDPPALAVAPPPAPAVPVVPVAPALLWPPCCRQPVTVICRLLELPAL